MMMMMMMMMMKHRPYAYAIGTGNDYHGRCQRIGCLQHAVYCRQEG
jgi:hypothetical protein